MNILFLDSIERDVYGGMEEWIRLAATGLAQRKHTVTVAGRKGSEYLRRVQASSDQISICELDISGDFNPLTIARLKKLIYDSNIEIVVVNFNKDIRLGGLAARLAGSANVIWSVGLDITKDSLIHKLLTPRLIDGVIVPSEALRKQITRHGYVRDEICRVIPIGIADSDSKATSEDPGDIIRKKYNIPGDCVIAVTVGRFVNQKGHIYLVEAATDIVKKHPEIRFLWLGDGPLENKLRSAIKTSNLENHFILAGMLDDVAPELAGSDLMIHPSIEEPFGIAVLEGMRAGLPVAAGNVGGIPEVVSEGETAILFEPRNPDDIAEKVSAILQDRDKMMAMGQAGRKRWQKLFKLENMIDGLEEYMSAVRKSSQSVTEN